jgi:diguanylate cyclase (GGDEF)-like protein/PAS domain S-box-containing protein
MNNLPLSLLIIEDGDENRASLERILSEAKADYIQVRSTNDVNHALRRFERGFIDALLLDCSASQDRVDEVARRAGANALAIPLLVLADQADEGQAIALLHAGAQDYLLKGQFNAQTLVHCVRSAIERQRVVIELEQKSREFQSNEARLLNVIVHNVDGMVVLDENHNVRFVNPAAERLLGKKGGALIGQPFSFPIREGECREALVEREGALPLVLEMRAVSAEWERSGSCLISLRDMTARRRAEEALRKSEERYALAVRGSKDGLWDWNLVTDEVYYSPRWKAMVGCDRGEIGNGPNDWFRRVHEQDIQRLRTDIADHVSGKTAHFENEHRLMHKDGSCRWVLCRGTAVRDAGGKAVRIAGSLGDITERKEAEKHLKRALSDLKFALASEKVLLDELDKRNKELVALSITDGLTGLYNHRFIQERFDFEFKRARRYDGMLSCMLLDIDHFKSVNDTYGHQFGDHVLREIATILRKRSREVDICGRYGGEEFMIVTNQPAAGAVQYASKLHAAIEEHVFEQNGRSTHVTVSIGIAEFRRDLRTRQEMIERADIALYKAKEDGRNLIRVWKEQEKQDLNALDSGGINALKAKFDYLSTQMRAAYMESTYALLRAVDAKDHYTEEHSQNVSGYAVELAKAINLHVDDIEIIKYAGLLHDVGKIGVSQEILIKTGPLTEEEFEILRKHPVIAVNILKDVKFLENELPIILHHHERFDGRGYPRGFKGREIPLGARILAVADAFDAMTTERYWKPKLSKRDALAELRRESGSQFSPDLVDAFERIARQWIDNEGESATGFSEQREQA